MLALAGDHTHESPADIAAGLLAEARQEAAGNLGDTLFDVPVPAGAEQVKHWEHDDGTGAWSRRVVGRCRAMDGSDTAVLLDGIQHPDGTVVWSCYVHADERRVWPAVQLRQWAAMLIEAADELDSLDS